MSTLAVRLTLPIPPSVNQMYRMRQYGGGVYKVKAAQKYGYEVLAAANQAGAPLTLQPSTVEIRLHVKDKRRRDLDNILKVLIDALAQQFKFDDSCIEELHVFKRLDPERPRVEVELR